MLTPVSKIIFDLFCNLFNKLPPFILHYYNSQSQTISFLPINKSLWGGGTILDAM